MDRRRFLLTSLAGAFAAPLAAQGQQASKTNRIGVFVPGSASGGDQFQQLVGAFRAGLRDLGWVEGQNVVVETRWGEGRIDEFPRIAAELLAVPVDVIVAWGPQVIHAAQQATVTVPIVMAIVHEPVAFGFVKSLARPGGNITGQSFQDSELGTKRLDLLRDVVPRTRRVAFLWDSGGGGASGLRAAESSARKLGLTTQVLEVRTVGRDTGGMSHCGTGTRLYVLSQRFRLAALRAALGFLQLPPRAPELRLLHRWLDSWSGIGLVVVGVELQGLRFSLSHIADGEWRATFMAHPMFAPAGFGVAATPWRAVQMAGRGARRSESCLILFHWQRAQVDQIARLEIILRFPLPATRRP